MNASLLILYNIRQGILARWSHYLSSIVIFSLLWINAYSGIRLLEIPGSLGDYFLSSFAGQRVSTNMEAVRISGTWLCVYTGFLHSSLGFLGDSMNEWSCQICVRSHGRNCWWLAMYLWSVLSTLSYFFLSLATLSLLTLFSGGNLTLSNSPDFALLKLYSEAFIAYEPLSSWQVGLIALLLPLAFAIVLGLLQLCLSLFISPVQSFLCCIVLSIVSSYYYSSLSLGSYAMTIRSEYISRQGLSPWQGLVFLGLIAAGIYFVGCLKAQRLDFLPRLKERV